MNRKAWATAAATAMFCTGALAQSLFDGTWRLDPGQPGPGRKPQKIQLLKGEYECRACSRPNGIKADGLDHAVSGTPIYDTLRVVVVNDHTIVETARKAGRTVLESTLTASADGATLTEHQILTLRGSPKLDLINHLARVSPGAKGAHAVSGTWQLTDSDLANHGDDTTYRMNGGTLSMSDRMGQSFSAKVDGSDAPYKGSAVFTTVSVKQLDSHTFTETDKRGKQVVRVDTWSVDPDGKTLHVRFDNHGQVVQQTAHKIQ